jgi:Lar family restriction alleviation protein
MKLKPCPFCSSNNIKVFKVEVFKASSQVKREDTDGHAPFCFDCGARGCIKDTERKAANAWNKRVVK